MRDVRTWLRIINDLRTAMAANPLPTGALKELVRPTA